MRDLPGLYWDQDKNRYFPLSSKPKTSSQLVHNPPPQNSNESSATIGQSTLNSQRSSKRKRGDVSWNATERLRASVHGPQSRRCMHEILCSQIASTSHATQSKVSVYSCLTAFKTSTAEGRAFYGDDHGWLYSFTDVKDRHGHGHDHDILVEHSWMPEINLTSAISSICISDSRFVATSFGPEPKVLVQDLCSGNTFILSPGNSIVHDIWTSNLRGRGLAIGAGKKAIFLSDIDMERSINVLDTQSDVFAVEQQENLVYTGSRNGSITRFDMRLDDLRGQKLLNDVFMAHSNSITHLNIVRDSQLIVSNMDGSLGMYDLRFARGSSPLLTFTGHVNSFTTNLALAIDTSEDFLFVSGQDRRIRAWSLQSGQALKPPTSPSSSTSMQPSITNPFCMEFTKPVRAMQVTSIREEIYLWAGSGNDLFRYNLGQQENRYSH